MQKFNRTIVFAAALLTLSATQLHAEQLGTNPKPKGQSLSVVTDAVLAVLSAMGM